MRKPQLYIYICIGKLNRRQTRMKNLPDDLFEVVFANGLPVRPHSCCSVNDQHKRRFCCFRHNCFYITKNCARAKWWPELERLKKLVAETTEREKSSRFGFNLFQKKLSSISHYSTLLLSSFLHTTSL